MGLTQAEVAIGALLGGRRARELEGETLEFKTDQRSADGTVRDLAEAAACLANARGGTLIVGVRDAAPGADAIVGSNLDPPRTQRRIFELTDPHLIVTCALMPCRGQQLLVIDVPASPDVHAVGSRFTERIADACVPMSAARIASVVADRRGDDWSALDSGLPASDVTPLAFAELRTLLDERSAASSVGASADEALLHTLGLVTSGGTLNNAGALLLSNDRGRRVEIAYTFRRTPSGDLLTNEHLEGPLVSVLRRVFELIAIRTDRTSVNLRYGQQLQIADLPDAAVRESIINAVMHRDYRTAAPISVEHSPARLVVTSPGPLVSGISIDTVLTAPSRTRNTALAYAIRMLGLAEAAGSGVDRMYAEMGRVGHRPPSFAADESHVAVTLIGGSPNAAITRYVSSLPREESVDADTVLVVLTLRSQRTVTASQLAPLVQKTADSAELVLERLASEPAQMLEITRETRRMRYPSYRFREHVIAALGPALTYQRRTTDSYDRTLIDVVRETGSINARLVALTLAVDAPNASRILADLVSRGILVRTSSATRGRTVTYGPGPTFPKRPRARRRSTDRTV